MCTLEDERLEPTAITHEKKGKWSEPNLQGIMFQPLIFRGVSRYCRYPLDISKIRCLECRVCLRRALLHHEWENEQWKKPWLFAENIEDSTIWPSYGRHFRISINQPVLEVMAFFRGKKKPWDFLHFNLHPDCESTSGIYTESIPSKQQFRFFVDPFNPMGFITNEITM